MTFTVNSYNIIKGDWQSCYYNVLIDIDKYPLYTTIRHVNIQSASEIVRHHKDTYMKFVNFKKTFKLPLPTVTNSNTAYIIFVNKEVMELLLLFSDALQPYAQDGKKYISFQSDNISSVNYVISTLTSMYQKDIINKIYYMNKAIKDIHVDNVYKPTNYGYSDRTTFCFKISTKNPIDYILNVIQDLISQSSLSLHSDNGQVYVTNITCDDIGILTYLHDVIVLEGTSSFELYDVYINLDDEVLPLSNIIKTINSLQVRL